MKNLDYEWLAQTELFYDIDTKALQEMLPQLNAHVKSYNKNAFILNEGEKAPLLALVLNGSVCIEHIDFWGNTTLLAYISSGDIFAETYTLLPQTPLLVSARAAANCKILFCNLKYINGLKDTKLLVNLLHILANKNLHLSRHIFQITSKDLRTKIKTYLSFEAIRNQSNEFNIPFDRQELANYLAANRSAVSAELSRMQRDGILETHKNHFRLLRPL